MARGLMGGAKYAPKKVTFQNKSSQLPHMLGEKKLYAWL